MQSVTGFLRLIRSFNLGYIILTQVLLQFCLLVPLYQIVKSCPGLTPTLDNFHFSLLVLSTVLVAAAGYIINDYFDVQIDEINKPDRILVDRVIARRYVMILHLFFNGLGIALGFYVAAKVGLWKLGFIQVFAACMLWFYSLNLKRQLFIGNLLVSLLTALVILTVWAYDVNFFTEAKHCSTALSGIVTQYMIGYAVFAFLVTLIRELIKDMEDIEGDRAGNCRTVPIVWGIKAAKSTTGFIILLVVALLVFAQFRFFSNEHLTPVGYIFVLIQAPLLYVFYLLFYADKASDFKYLSNLVKFVMLTGICYLLYFRYTLSALL